MTVPVPISILMPSYNAKKYLVAAIESVEDQLIEGDELLLQDGLSTDGSIADVRARFPEASWLKIVSERDQGQSDALQKALDRAVNTYVMWLNADDVVYPGALAAVRSGLAAGPDILCGRSTIFNNSGRVVRTYSPGPFTPEAFRRGGSDLFTGSLALRTQLVREVGGFDAQYQYCMDLDLVARLADQHPVVAYIPEVVGGLRWHAESKGGSTLWPIVREATQVRMAHAHTTRERAVALGASTAYLLAGLAQPIRHSKPYSMVRERLSQQSTPPAAAAS